MDSRQPAAIRHGYPIGGYEKDRIVGAMIDSDLHPYLVGLAAIGIILLIGSSILVIPTWCGPARRGRRARI